VLRCTTWLAPGLPLELFEAVATELGAAVSARATVTSCTDRSGPPPDDDPFARGEVDVGFLCAPSFRQLLSVELLGAPVFVDPRAEHRAVYFSDLVVRAGIDATRFEDLTGCRVGYNDAASLSGYESLMARLRDAPIDIELVCTGGHRRSLELLVDGTIDAAPIDSNTIVLPGVLPPSLRVIETWGPHPVQPVVARASLDAGARESMSAALVSLADREPELLAPFGVERFVAVTRAHYDVVD